jgi:hypothetical protein
MTDATEKTAAMPAADDTAAKVADEPKKIDPDEPNKEPKPDAAGAKDAGGEDEGEGDEAGDDQPERKKRSGAARAKRREEYLLSELRERDRRLEALQRQSPKGDGGEAKDEPPKEEDFNGDWAAYLAAQSAYQATKAVKQEFRSQLDSEQDRRQADVRRDRDIAHLERIDEAREVITDFDEVMANTKGVMVRPDVIDEIKSSDKSHLLMYHLAKNPEKLRELNSMSSRELAREIGRLEGSIRMPAGKKQTTAPPPPTALKGGAAPAVDLGAADMEAYVAARKRQGFGQRRQ